MRSRLARPDAVDFLPFIRPDVPLTPWGPLVGSTGGQEHTESAPEWGRPRSLLAWYIGSNKRSQ
ncbi:MAG: hypothetical protein RLZZ618_919 [Pseudomonadota bacterium]